MRRIFWILLIVSTLVLPYAMTGKASAQAGRQSKRPLPTDIPPRRVITISNPSIVSDTPRDEGTRKRRNIGNFFSKMRDSRATTIAYLGGSITAGTGARAPEKSSYRALVTDWLRRNFPQSEISEINAGISNTGSLYGAMRARRDCIAFKPDLVFIEFALDDVVEDESGVKKAFEGLIRQLLVVPQPPEVVVLYAAGPKRNPEVIEWQETIAAHYSIPAINLDEAVWAQIESGRLKAQEFWARGINPSDLGHRFYSDAIIDFLAAQSKLEPTPIERSLPLPLVSDEMNYGEFKAIAEIWHEATWRTVPVADRRLPARLLFGGKPGSQIEYYFEGTVLGLSFLKGPDSGTIELLIDGKPAPSPLRKINLYNSRRQFGTAIMTGGLGPGEHKLTIRISDERNPASTASNVRLGYLIIGGQRPEKL